jgi:hypothetical protein
MSTSAERPSAQTSQNDAVRALPALGRKLDADELREGALERRGGDEPGVLEEPFRVGGATEAQRRAGRDQLQVGRIAGIARGLELRHGTRDRLRAPAQIAERERDLRLRRHAASAEQAVGGTELSQRRSKLGPGTGEFAELGQRHPAHGPRRRIRAPIEPFQGRQRVAEGESARCSRESRVHEL